MRKCNHCGELIDDDAVFCTNCGRKTEIAEGRKCPSCGAALDGDSMFCTECGVRVDPGSPVQPVQQQAVSAQAESTPPPPPVQEAAGGNDAEADDSPKSKTTLIAVIAALAVLLCGAGGYLYYDNVYLPEKTDREAPRYYTMANAVVLRSSKSSGADYNKIGSLPYGTELITYEQDSEWSRVKVNSVNADGNKQVGFVASPLLLSKPDFFLLNSVFGDQESKENVFTTKCRLAVLNYFKARGYIGKIDEQLRTESGITTTPGSDNQWQIFCRPKDVKPNNVLFKRLYDRNSRFTDFAVVIKNIVNGDRKLLYFYFDEDETPHFLTEANAPSEGYIKDIEKTAYGDIKATYTY